MSQIIFPINQLPLVIDIGKQAEKGVTRIGFDMHEWLDDWPGMKFSVQPVRPGEAESYIAATEQVGDILFWLVGAVDTEKAGAGMLEVLGVTEDERKLSAMCRTSIATTNTVSTAEIPEPNQPWVDQVILAGEGAKAGAQAASKSASAAETAKADADAQATAAGESAKAAAKSATDAAESVKDVFIVKVGTDKLCSHTKQEIVGAASAGKVCLMVYYNGEVLKYKGIEKHGDETTCPYFVGSLYEYNGTWYATKVTVLSGSKTTFDGSPIRISSPQSLRFTGAVNATYDGSKYVKVEIPRASLPETADPLKQLVTDADGKVAWEDRLAYKYTTTSEVVNLAATVLENIDDNGDGVLDNIAFITIPWATDIVAGSMATIAYNGTNYECEAIAYNAIVPDAPEGPCALGNISALGFEGIDGSNADAPFTLVTQPSTLAVEQGGIYGILMIGDGSASVTLSVTSKQTQTTIKTIDPELLGEKTITLTFDAEGNITSDTPFAEAWAMTPAELQSAIVIKAPYNNFYGNRTYTVESVGKQEGSQIFPGQAIALRVQSAIPFDTSDVSQNDVVSYIGWTAAGLSKDSATTQFLPRIVLSNSYLKYVNGYWRAVSIDTLKEDLTCVVNVTVDSSETVIDCDKTYAQVAEAINAGKDVRALVKCEDGSMGLVLRLAMLGGNGCAFNGTWIVGSGADAVKAAYTFAMNSDGTNSYEMRTF